MKLTLKELELAIPTIDLLESRKIVGGYNEDQNIAFEVAQSRIVDMIRVRMIRWNKRNMKCIKVKMGVIMK